MSGDSISDGHFSQYEIDEMRQMDKEEQLKKQALKNKVNKSVRSTSSFCIPGYSFKLIKSISTGLVSRGNSFDKDIQKVVYKLKRKAYKLKGNGIFNVRYTTSSAPSFDLNGEYNGDHIIIIASADAVKMKPITNYKDYINSIKAYCFNNSSNLGHSKPVNSSDVQKAKKQFEDLTKSGVEDYKQAKANEQNDSGRHGTFIPIPPYFLP